LAVLVFIAGVAGCAVDDQACPAVDGVYVPQYQQVSGDCGPIASPNSVKFQGTSAGMVTTMETRLNEDVTTVIVHKGCTVRMTQQVALKSGQVQSQIDGESLRVRSASTLQGQVDYVRYDPLSQVACQGRYNATFSKNMVPLGATP
jgi:hypothetical protein